MNREILQMNEFTNTLATLYKDVHQGYFSKDSGSNENHEFGKGSSIVQSPKQGSSAVKSLMS